MNTTAIEGSATADCASRSVTDLFAPWVDAREEICRRGRRQITAVNQRTGHAVRCSPDELTVALSDTDPSDGTAGVTDAVVELRTGAYLTGAHDPGPVPAIRRRGDGLVWTNANQFVTRAHDHLLHHLFSRSWIAAQVGLAVLGAVLFATAVVAAPVQLRATPAQIPVIVALGLVAVAIHELGHALVTVHFRRSVRLVGLRLHLGSPAFYVDSTDALLLTRRQRLLQAAAGPWAEWLATTVAIVAWTLVPADGAVALVLHRFVIVNTIGIAMNLLPFVGLDGALLLSDMVREPDLAERSRDALTRTGPRRWWLISYALANTAVAGMLLISAALFWWQLFGTLVTTMCSAGPAGVALLAAVAAFGSRRAVSSAASLFPAAGCLRSRLSFRMERRWRVRSIRAFRSAMPEIGALDARALGILAGQLTRVPHTAPAVDGEIAVDHGSDKVVLPADWPRILATA